MEFASTLSREQLCTAKALEDLNQVTERGHNRWKDMLWRTFDVLKKYGYAGYNFDAEFLFGLDLILDGLDRLRGRN